MSIELCKELLHITLPGGEHKGLVTVVSAAPVTRACSSGHRKLGNFLAVAKDPELGLAGKHFLAAQQRGLTAHDSDLIIL